MRKSNLLEDFKLTRFQKDDLCIRKIKANVSLYILCFNGNYNLKIKQTKTFFQF